MQTEYFLKRLPFLVFAFGVLVVAGCGNGNMPMGGTVTFADNGEPVTHGMVCFTTGTHSATGQLEPDGKYVIGSMKDKDGLPPGTYKVYLSIPTRMIDPTDIQAGEQETTVDKKFTSADATPLSVTVDGSQRTFDIKVDRAE